ncbi:uncharacterized protein [Lolium perenne]|uniref:uncharacterized protein n=1 Tax=Lolium perenne TaxID=4522 RepID=UPI003A9A326C
MIELLTKKGEVKENKAKELEIRRAQVDLSHSEGEASSDDNSNSVLVVKKKRGRSSSLGGPMDKFCKLPVEDVVAARKGKSLAVKVQSKLSTAEREKKRNRACEYICQFFYEASIPHTTVNLPSFDLMLEAIVDFGGDLRGPTPYEMGGPFLQKRKQRVLDSFKPHKQSWELSGCTVMTDAWTDIRGRGVMNLVVHSAYGVCFLDSVDCSAMRKDGKYIFELVDNWIEQIGEKNVVQVVTDGASVNNAAACLLKAKRPSIFWNGCAAHCIDLMLEDIGKLPTVDTTISKGRALTVFLYAHTRVLDLMRKFLGKDLVRSGITRFATAYLNLKSLLDSKKELMRLFRSDELHDLGYLQKVKGSTAAKTVRSETFWKQVDTAVNYFEPLANVLRRMDSDVPAMGFLYGHLLDAKKEISARFDNQQHRFQRVSEIIDKRWDNKLKQPLHKVGYYLNPYYYYENKVEIELDETFREALVACISKMVSKAEMQDRIMEEVEQYKDALGSFGRDMAVRQRRNKRFDPAKWWMNHGTSAPNLRPLAAKILGLTCSSSACERNWSVFQQVQTKRRNILLHNKMRDFVFVKANSNLQHKKENKNWDPIEKVVDDVLEDETNEWITGIVPEQAQEVEPEGAQDEAATSHEVAAQAQSQNKRGVHLRKKLKILPIHQDEELQSLSSSSDSEDGDGNAMHSPYVSDCDDSY